MINLNNFLINMVGVGGGCWVAMAECNGSCVVTRIGQWCAGNFFLALLARFYCHPGDCNLCNIPLKLFYK